MSWEGASAAVAVLALAGTLERRRHSSGEEMTKICEPGSGVLALQLQHWRWLQHQRLLVVVRLAVRTLERWNAVVTQAGRK